MFLGIQLNKSGVSAVGFFFFNTCIAFAVCLALLWALFNHWSSQLYQVDAIILILQMRKLRYKEVKSFALHTVGSSGSVNQAQADNLQTTWVFILGSLSSFDLENTT